MSTATIERPLAVGLHGEHAVHIRGRVDAVDADTVTIEGWRLPMRLLPGVVTASAVWPDDPVEQECRCGDECDRDHCDDGDCQTSCECEQSDAMHRAIESHHDAEHGGPFMWCSDPLCRAANGGAP